MHVRVRVDSPMQPPRMRRKDKLLHVLALLRLGLVRKKALLFVNSIDAGFRLRLFLEAFGVRAAVLNAELPLNSRHHILQVCITSLCVTLIRPLELQEPPYLQPHAHA